MQFSSSASRRAACQPIEVAAPVRWVAIVPQGLLAMAFVVLGVGQSASAADAMYKCVESGKTSYSDRPCAAGTQETVYERAKFYGEPISLNFQNVALGAVMQVIGDFSGVPIVLETGLETRLISVVYKDLPWDQVLVDIARENGLAVRYSKTDRRIYMQRQGGSR